jgi:hypothetical protein
VTNDANFHLGIYTWTTNGWYALSISSNYTYLPSFHLPWPTSAVATPIIDLFNSVYKENFSPATVGTHYRSSTNALVNLPDYDAEATDFYYVVTYYDPALLTIDGIAADGKMTYRRAAGASSDSAPPENTYINVVMIRK